MTDERTNGRTEDGGKWKIGQCSVGPETAKSKVDLNSIYFSFQIHTRYRRVDTGNSVYIKIFTPDNVTFIVRIECLLHDK